MKYNHITIEPKWQKRWEQEGTFTVHHKSTGEKRYVLDMFPYPSSAGLHVGHPEGYTATDVVSRCWRMKGYEVFHPMGWDAFGLPAENYAIKQGIHPRETTWKNIETFRRQIKSFGFSYDWSREINTASPEYYRWTQWLFLHLYTKGLAYKRLAPVNWCASCQTVLAREQVIEGRCERCKNQVVQKELEQWFFKITAYADRLLSDLERLDWPEPIKLMQRNWIGRSEGINITYTIEGGGDTVTCFTTRPDTNFGATFIVIAPEAEFVKRHLNVFPNKSEVGEYLVQASKKDELERISEGRKKTGVNTGLCAMNNLNGKKLPIYIADFVFANVGTGAVVGVPGHDLRDYEFARAMGIEVVRVVVGPDGDTSPITRPQQVWEEAGTMVNSSFLDGMDIHTATATIMDYLEQKGWGRRMVQYRLRDWLVSRQRYWGAPIPIIYCIECGEAPVPEGDLPVVLPNDVDFRPTGESPLARSKEFHDVACPQCGARGKGVCRESDTMDTFVDSSWYFLRYTDPHNDKEFASREQLQTWLPVDLYVGGAEHAVLHLLYARFITKVLKDAGLVDFDEPFAKLRNQGMILAEDGRKMSKSLGNVINPDEVVRTYGADTMRLYEMFIGPLEDAKPWSTKSILGVRRFLERVWTVGEKLKSQNAKRKTNEDHLRLLAKDEKLQRLMHETIKKVTEDIEEFKFNTAIAQLMTYTNELSSLSEGSADMISGYRVLLTLLSPFAPHITEEIWERIGYTTTLAQEPWPRYDASKIVHTEATVIVQVDGKKRALITVSADAEECEVIAAARATAGVRRHMEGKSLVKKIYVKGKLLNLVTNSE